MNVISSRFSAFLAVSAAILLLIGCVTVGRQFPAQHVEGIIIGETTRQDIQAKFGEPWRTGSDDGNPTWTFGWYRYSAFSAAKTRDLVVTFDKQEVVISYSFNASYPQSE